MKKLLFFVFAVVSSQLWALNAPNPTKPSTGISNAYTRQQFYWELVADAGSYELQVDTTKAFNSPLLVERTFSSNSQQYVYHFHYNTHYYWRMRSVSKTDTDVKSDWCSIREFTTLSQVDLVTPNQPDGARYYYPSQTFKWKNSYGSTRYVIEIDTVPTFDSQANYRTTYSSYASNTTEQLTKEIGNLYLNCTCYWRVKAYNNSDSSAWSEVYQFPTIARIQGTSPKDLDNAKTSLTFYWEYKAGLNKVIIELDTTNRFNSPAKRTVQSSGSSQDYCYTTISELYFGKDYYWRIKGYHSKDTTDWSNVLHFKTYNHCNLSSPADSATGLYTQVSLYYSFVSDISKYQVQLDTTPQFNSSQLQTRMSSAGSSDYAYEIFSELLFGQDFYWRVRRCHSKDTSNWSQTRLFTTAKACPLTQSPTDSATEVSTSPYLYFNTAKGISYYQQQIDTTPLFNSPVMENKIEKCSYESDYNYSSFHDLYFGTTYYRRTRRCHSKDTSDWSVTRCFTTITRGAYSTSYSIAKGTTGQSVTPKLYYAYRSYIDSVEIQIDTTLNFDSPLFESIRVKEASSQTYAYEVPKRTLLYGTTYYWRIRDIHSKDISDWTVPRYFTTTYQLSQPTLCEPANQTVVNNGEVVYFVWNTCEDATQYVYQLSDDGQFNTYLHQETLTDTTTQLVPPENSILYWRIQAINDKGRSPWSDVRGVNTTTPQPTQLNVNVNENENQARKIMENGHLYIIVDDKRYDATGLLAIKKQKQ